MDIVFHKNQVLKKDFFFFYINKKHDVHSALAVESDFSVFTVTLVTKRKNKLISTHQRIINLTLDWIKCYFQDLSQNHWFVHLL